MIRIKLMDEGNPWVSVASDLYYDDGTDNELGESGLHIVFYYYEFNDMLIRDIGKWEAGNIIDDALIRGFADLSKYSNATIWLVDDDDYEEDVDE